MSVDVSRGTVYSNRLRTAPRAMKSVRFTCWPPSRSCCTESNVNGNYGQFSQMRRKSAHVCSSTTESLIVLISCTWARFLPRRASRTATCVPPRPAERPLRVQDGPSYRALVLSVQPERSCFRNIETPLPPTCRTVRLSARGQSSIRNASCIIGTQRCTVSRLIYTPIPSQIDCPIAAKASVCRSSG